MLPLNSTTKFSLGHQIYNLCRCEGMSMLTEKTAEREEKSTNETGYLRWINSKLCTFLYPPSWSLLLLFWAIILWSVFGASLPLALIGVRKAAIPQYNQQGSIWYFSLVTNWFTVDGVAKTYPINLAERLSGLTATRFRRALDSVRIFLLDKCTNSWLKEMRRPGAWSRVGGNCWHD